MMNIDDLIKEGEIVKQTCTKTSKLVPEYLSGIKYEIWINNCIIFMDENYRDSPLYEHFSKVAKIAVGNTIHCYNEIMGILRTIKERE